MSTTRVTMRSIALARILRLTLAMAATAFAMTPAFAQAASEHSWVAPERPSHRANTVPATTEAVQRGRDLFHRDCEQCHGKAGHGDGPLSGSLSPRPADLASHHVQSQLDGALFWKMTEGRGVMPRAALSESDKWSVVDFIRSFEVRQ